MSTPYTDNDIALPHASLLAYFRRPTTAQEPDSSSESSPPPYNTCHESHSDFFDVPRVSGVVEDEESQRTISAPFHDNHNHGGKTDAFRIPTLANHRLFRRSAAYTSCCFWCSVSTFMLAVLAIFFVVDLGFSQFGYGTGMAQGMLHWRTGSSNTQHEVSTCTYRCKHHGTRP